MASRKELSFQLGLSSTFSSNVEDPEIAAELTKLYNAINLLASKLDEYTGAIPYPLADRPYIAKSSANRSAGTNRFYGYATVNLLAGTLVYWNASGQLAKASSASGVALLMVLEDTVAGDYAAVTRQGVVTGLAGLTAGSAYVASTTAGAIATSVATGNTRRYVGFALSSTELYFEPDLVGVTV